MPKPKCYAPEQDQRYQLMCRQPSVSREWEHCDYAATPKERTFLKEEYRVAYGPGFEIKSVTLPQKFWPKPAVLAAAIPATNAPKEP